MYVEFDDPLHEYLKLVITTDPNAPPAQPYREWHKAQHALPAPRLPDGTYVVTTGWPETATDVARRHVP